jgi:hypothetical protein
MNKPCSQNIPTILPKVATNRQRIATTFPEVATDRQRIAIMVAMIKCLVAMISKQVAMTKRCVADTKNKVAKARNVVAMSKTKEAKSSIAVAQAGLHQNIKKMLVAIFRIEKKMVGLSGQFKEKHYLFSERRRKWQDLKNQLPKGLTLRMWRFQMRFQTR